ncbi:NF-X1-type zinc finger protein NFXL1-like [Cryptomeria japonica]|uniref:NF-X1-type zinc finger protein NFXL1-like n=1 Tax=Cryptomeria japonica TaxID=3369 RepID=UPI0027DAA1D5|nr:NF-X1-type zinc finger protein NFXL1-like [Cryptomeria japonica]
MICYEMVGKSAAIWSCNSCYALFHLHCIRKWARAPTSRDLSAGQSQRSNWRCPGCQSVQYSRPEDLQYYCFCGKMQNPYNDFYLTPHSCGEPCGKSLDKGKEMSRCPHTCTLLCHPGPCPPCTAMAAPQPCPCGKKTTTRRCSDQKPAESCGQVCEQLLTCGRHLCDKICHEGPCGSCTILTNASCFCGKKENMMLCGDLEFHGELEWKSGVYACENLCMKMLSCQNHNCSLGCHPGECKECDLLPEKLKTCPCGKTQILNERKSCLDPVPTCSEVCEKLLSCGKHKCIYSCHQGICPPCLVSVDQKCRCGSSSRKVSCWKTTSETEDNKEFLCEKVCGQKKHCGRHRCNEKCCPLSHRGRSDIQTGDWDPHLCLMPCGKKMRCGQHYCQELCHSGYCPPCLETNFTDLSCACGKTSIPPAVPCGTPIPSCAYPCSIPQPCGHSATHNCHLGECPPCTASAEITCSCGRMTAKVPCDAGGNNIRADPVFEASIYHKLPARLQPTESHLTRVPMGQRKLACDDECAKLERKKTVANAFDISTSVDLQEVNGKTSEMLADLIRREPQWVSDVEDRFKYLVLGRTKINTNGIRVHIFNAVPKEKRDILKLLAGRWNLSVFWAGWEPRRFFIVQGTQKSRAPARNLLLNGPLQTTGQVQPPIFNSLVDMDPRLVFALFDLPRETDVSVSSLILRFGGECELVWLNDKNALAIFTDMTRAATAMRRVAHATAYQGAVNQTSTPIG